VAGPSASIPDDPGKLPPGRHGLPREVVVQSQRERMLRAVAHVSAEKGYTGMSVADIIGAAGVSRRTFYEHFEDKEQCFLVSYDAAVHQVTRVVEEAYAGEDAWRDGARAALRRFLEYLAAEPEFARMCIVEVLAAGPRALARRDAAMERFRRVVEAGRDEAGVSPSVPALAGETAVGAIYEVVYARILRGEVAQLPELLPDMLYCVVAPFLGPGEAAELARRG
jgi:AcrR family transcriptional regulator